MPCSFSVRPSGIARNCASSAITPMTRSCGAILVLDEPDILTRREAVAAEQYGDHAVADAVIRQSIHAIARHFSACIQHFHATWPPILG